MSKSAEELKLYSLNGLTRFGIGEKELYRWKKTGKIKPFTYSGKKPLYRYDDFLAACEQIRLERELVKPQLKLAGRRTKKTENNSMAKSLDEIFSQY